MSFRKSFLLYFILLLPALHLWGQDCNLILNGYVFDSGTNGPLDVVHLQLAESKQGTLTDSTGYFSLDNLCAGDYHLIISHVGCSSETIFMSLQNDTTVELSLDHSIGVLESVEVKGLRGPSNTQKLEYLRAQEIRDKGGESLANILESIPGVSSIKNGSSIAKPIVQGLTGNRLLILNNGIAQSGQQWGADHAPEIDPLVANNISVIKGAGALAYLGGNLGSVILLEPSSILPDPHLHGRAAYYFDTNGRGQATNIQLQKFSSKFAWKLNGTLKKSGDNKTADYFLRNTGAEEYNVALQMEKGFSDKHRMEFFASSFNTELGVLRGSHIGNLTDLEEALEKEVPFYTEEAFRSDIEAPKQKVRHHLAKLRSKYFLTPTNWLDLTLAVQHNDRKEFDVRRSEWSDKPALSLIQNTLYLGADYHHQLSSDWKLKSIGQYRFVDNTNQPGTGILPLIPDYLSNEIGLAGILSREKRRTLWEFAARYDLNMQNVVAITRTLPREIVRYENTFHQVNASIGFRQAIKNNSVINVNLGIGSRTPAINELYSFGLHQGVSGIEEGQIDLSPEYSRKISVNYQYQSPDKWGFSFLVYYQNIRDYIYLQAQEEVRLTIRGAFPVFKYEQTNAVIAGFDFDVQYSPYDFLELTGKYSFIRGRDKSNEEALVNIPANAFETAFLLKAKKPINVFNTSFENLEFGFNQKYVFRKSDIEDSQDFLASPEAYNLLGLQLAGEFQVGFIRTRITARVNNMLNTSYRDYLNRQRYFADDLGINASLGIQLKF